MTWGLYVAVDSRLHRVPAAAKLTAMFVASLLVLAIDGWVALAVLACGAVSLFPLARLPWRAVLDQLRLPLLFIAAIAVANGLLTSWSLGAVVGLRFAILICLATLIALTTRVSDMLAAFERGLAPLRRFGVDPERVAFVLALTIRLIPVLAAHVGVIREAQQARGLDRSIVALAVPLLIRGLRTADALTEAIEARGGIGNDVT
jgi:biotin transport system permease protein